MRIWRSTRFEQKDSNLSHVEVDEVFGFVSDIGAEVPSNNAVPSRVVFLVKFLLDIGSDILFDVEFLKGHIGAVYGVLLHLFVHVCMFNHGFFLCGGH